MSKLTFAVTNHAVNRYRERVQGAADIDAESIREQIRHLAEEGFDRQTVMDHPVEKDRVIVPFQSGKTVLYLSIGPNDTNYPGDRAVINVLFEKETGGRAGVGVTLGDAVPSLKEFTPAPKRPTKYLVRIGELEQYECPDDAELTQLLHRRKANPELVQVFEKIDLDIEVKYEIKRRK